MRSTAPSGSPGSSPIASQERARLLDDVVAGAAAADPLERGQQLEQRVVGEPGHRGVAGAAAARTRKRNVPFSAQQTP